MPPTARADRGTGRGWAIRSACRALPDASIVPARDAAVATATIRSTAKVTAPKRTGQHRDDRGDDQQPLQRTLDLDASDDDAGIIHGACRCHRPAAERRRPVSATSCPVPEVTIRRSGSGQRAKHGEQAANPGVLEHPQLGIAAGKSARSRPRQACPRRRSRHAWSRTSTGNTRREATTPTASAITAASAVTIRVSPGSRLGLRRLMCPCRRAVCGRAASATRPSARLDRKARNRATSSVGWPREATYRVRDSV